MIDIDQQMQVVIRDLLAAGIPLPQAVEQFRRRIARAALEQTDGNVAAASRLIGIHRNTFHKDFGDVITELRNSSGRGYTSKRRFSRR